jgi:hypothetical protein
LPVYLEDELLVYLQACARTKGVELNALPKQGIVLIETAK